jgi:hypothetical protein
MLQVVVQAGKTGTILAKQPVPSGRGDYYAHLIFEMQNKDVVMKLQVREQSLLIILAVHLYMLRSVITYAAMLFNGCQTSMQSSRTRPAHNAACKNTCT